MDKHLQASLKILSQLRRGFGFIIIVLTLLISPITLIHAGLSVAGGLGLLSEITSLNPSKFDSWQHAQMLGMFVVGQLLPSIWIIFFLMGITLARKQPVLFLKKNVSMFVLSVLYFALIIGFTYSNSLIK